MDTRHINLRQLIGGDFKRESSTNGGEYSSSCPFCKAGHDRFRVWPDPHHGNPRFWCRQCDAKGDAIDFIMLTQNGVSFREACTILGLQSDLGSQTRPIYPQSTPPRRSLLSAEKAYAALTDPAWQEAARKFYLQAVERLWDKEGEIALNYLLNERRLTKEVIQSCRLGYTPTTHDEQWGSEKVWLYAGIVIPWLIGDICWKVNIRRRPSELKRGDKRYRQAAGGANGLYLADRLTTGCTAIVTEGEFDALSIFVHAQPAIEQFNLIAVATGSTTNAHLRQWVASLAKADYILLAFDQDENGAGDKATQWWTNIFGEKATRLLPIGHDVNDMVKTGCDLNAWVSNGLKAINHNQLKGDSPK